MYNRYEASKLKQEFWTVFGRYMQPVQPAGGQKVNWVNYKTGKRGTRFMMDAGKDGAGISVMLYGDDAIRRRNYSLLQQFADSFTSIDQQEWTWTAEEIDEQGKAFSTISVNLTGVNIYDRNNWPAIISFLKQSIILLDEIWFQAGDFIENG